MQKTSNFKNMQKDFPVTSPTTTKNFNIFYNIYIFEIIIITKQVTNFSGVILAKNFSAEFCIHQNPTFEIHPIVVWISFRTDRFPPGTMNFYLKY